MKKFTLCAAAAAAMAGMTVMTSQAAVMTYVVGGNCGGSNGNNMGIFDNSCFDSGFLGGSGNFSNNSCGNTGNLFSGNGSGNNCSVDQILQMLVPSNSGSSCFGSWDNGCGALSGGQDFMVIPGCSGTVDDVWNPSFPSMDCLPGLPGCQDPGGWNLGGQNQGCGNAGIEDPGCGNPGTQNPGIGNPGNQNPGTGNQGNQNQGAGNTGSQNQGTGNQGSQNQGTGNQGSQNQGTGNTGSQNQGTGNTGIQNPGSADTYAQQVIALVNEERAKVGLAPVAENPQLSAAAMVRAQETTYNFSHTRPNGSYYDTVLSQNGISHMGSGENIAYGQQTAAAVMNGWMNSQGHRANILNGSFTNIGVACYENANGVKYWVQLFTY